VAPPVLLIVDPDRDHREALGAALERRYSRDYGVHAFEAAGEALAYLAAVGEGATAVQLLHAYLGDS
jgi:hypothetical protein